MAKDPDQRYPTCLVLAAATRTALIGGDASGSPAPSAPRASTPASRPGRAKRRTRASVVGAISVALIVLGVILVSRRGSGPSPDAHGVLSIPTGLARIDPRTNRVVARVAHQELCCVTLVAGTVWATAPDGLLKISPTTNEVVATIPGLCCPLGIREGPLRLRRTIRHDRSIPEQGDPYDRRPAGPVTLLRVRRRRPLRMAGHQRWRGRVRQGNWQVASSRPFRSGLGDGFRRWGGGRMDQRRPQQHRLEDRHGNPGREIHPGEEPVRHGDHVGRPCGSWMRRTAC